MEKVCEALWGRKQSYSGNEDCEEVLVESGEELWYGSRSVITETSNIDWLDTRPHITLREEMISDMNLREAGSMKVMEESMMVLAKNKRSRTTSRDIASDIRFGLARKSEGLKCEAGWWNRTLYSIKFGKVYPLPYLLQHIWFLTNVWTWQIGKDWSHHKATLVRINRLNISTCISPPSHIWFCQ